MADTELYLVRHAQAEDGVAEADDPGLSGDGRDATRRLAQRLRRLEFDSVRHGRARRAAETAALLGDALGLRPEESDLLADRTPVPSPPRRDRYPVRYHGWLDDTAPAEADVDGRGLDAALAALTAPGQGRQLLVTHSFVIGWFVRAALDAPEWRWLVLAPANASLTVLRSGPALVAFNDTGHLTPQVP